MDSQLFHGIVDSTITRNEGWHFGRLGRFLERADKTSRFLDVKYFILLPEAQDVGGNLDILQWSGARPLLAPKKTLATALCFGEIARSSLRTISSGEVATTLEPSRQSR